NRCGSEVEGLGGPARLRRECHVRVDRAGGVPVEREPPVGGSEPGWRQRSEDPGGGRELSGQRHLRGGCRDRRTVVPLASGGTRRGWRRARRPDIGLRTRDCISITPTDG